MDALSFQQLLSEEVKSYKALLETAHHDWTLKGFIDVEQNIYALSSDTKLISKALEMMLLPRLENFAQRQGLTLEYPSKQNFYPDLIFKDEVGHLFAVDFKSSYYNEDNKVNGLTLGSYWGYFRNRDLAKNTDYPYNAFCCHLVLGMLYKRRQPAPPTKSHYAIQELPTIPSVLQEFIFFLQPKWKIASDRPGSGNTRNIGGTIELDKLIAGKGVFSELGEHVFDHYWMNFYNQTDAEKAGIGTSRYHNLATYRAYLEQEHKILTQLQQ